MCIRDRFSGHQGIKKTIGIIKQRYYWRSLAKDVEDYISQCVSCNQRNPVKATKAPLGTLPSSTKPFEFVSMDIVGPLPVSSKGNKYLLTFIDYLTRYCEAIPIPNQTAETITQEFVHKIITRYGVPKQLLTDQGRNFLSTLFKGVCELLSIRTVSYTHLDVYKRQHRNVSDAHTHKR